MNHPPAFDAAHDALNRMKRACERGTGCHLTADMVASLGLTAVASLWDEDDPRKTKRSDQQSGETTEAKPYD